MSEEQQGNINIQNKRRCEAPQGNTEFKLVYTNNTKNKIIFSVINEQANFFDRQLHIRKFLVSSTDPKYHVNYCHQFVPGITSSYLVGSSSFVFFLVKSMLLIFLVFSVVFFCFVCLRSVSCAQNRLSLYIVHFLLLLRFSLTFI